MTVNVSYQRGFTPFIADGISIPYSRMFVPFITSRGITVSSNRLFVPFVESVAPPATVSRRNFMSFQP